MGLDLTGVGAVADLASNLVNRFFPDKTKAEQAQLAAVLQEMQGQLEVNRIEAASSSVFTSGWRPFIGWVCGAACSWNWVFLPMARLVIQWSGSNIQVSPADISEMFPLLLGMLGLGGLRTVEKIKGVASR